MSFDCEVTDDSVVCCVLVVDLDSDFEWRVIAADLD